MRIIDKKIVVQYLDSKCDRQLFLSIMNHGGKKTLSDSERNTLEIPERFKLRSRGLNISRKQGKNLEAVYYEVLKDQFQSSTDFSQLHTNMSLAEKDFLLRCQSGLQFGHIFLETSFSATQLMTTFYQQLNVDLATITDFPLLGFMRPDILLVVDITFLSNLKQSPFEVLPDGDIREIAADDPRLLLVVADVKLAEEASTSQFAETALYAWMLSNWLQHHHLQDRYAVADIIGIWTRKTSRKSNGSRHVFEGFTSQEKLISWFQELSIRTFDQYMLSIRQVLIKEIRHVLAQPKEWQKLEYHLSPSCDTCDFLGCMDQTTNSYYDKDTCELIHSFHQHYCAHRAYAEKHLSCVSGLTKGASRVLRLGGVHSIPELNGCDPQIFMQHSELKKQRTRILEKADAVLKRSPPSFFLSKNVTLAAFPNLGIMFHINYDISNGLTASFAVQGAYYPVATYEQRMSDPKPQPHFFKRKEFLVEELSDEAELKQFEAFLAAIEEMFNYAAKPENNLDTAFDMSKMSGRPTVQFYCWDKYQLDFIRKVLSRHLNVLLSGQYSRALLWLFSPDELIDDPAYFKATGKQQKMMAPYICVLKDIVQEHGKWPVETAYPLLVMAACIDDEFKEFYKNSSWLYKAQLGDYIPRERILEIWLNEVAKSDIERERKADPTLDDQQVYDAVYQGYLRRYKTAAGRQVQALSILRRFIANNQQVSKLGYASPVIIETLLERSQVLGGTSIKSLPADSQLWTVFTILDDQVSLLQYQQEVVCEVSNLESRYACIVLQSKLEDHELVSLGIDKTQYVYVDFYWISGDSVNSKIRDGDGFLTVLKQSGPGFPLSRPIDLIKASGNQRLMDYFESTYTHKQYCRFSDLLNGSIVAIDRIRGWVGVNWFKDKIVNDLVYYQLLDLSDVALGIAKPLPRAHVTRLCVKEIGHPTVAYPDPVSLRALLKEKPESPNKKQEILRAAEVLWTGDRLHDTIIDIDKSALDGQLDWVQKQTQRHLPDESQRAAIESSLSRMLNVIWGPPGTGKTDTAVYILGSMLKHASDSGQDKRLLITGPTKRAVIEILSRLQPVLAALEQSKLALICLQGSRSYDYNFILDDDSCWSAIKNKAVGNGIKDIVGKGGLEDKFEHISDIREFLLQPLETSLTVVATHHHSLYPLLTGISIKHDPNKAQPASARAELFDYILVDESSQVDVPASLPILNSLDKAGQISFVGDHLQMPPIQQAESPLGAEHLLGSIQDYLLTRHKIEPDTLLVNYRSNEVIVNYGKRIGYPSKLSAYNGAQLLSVASTPLRKPNHYPLQLDDKTLHELFCPIYPVVSIRYRDGMSGQANPFESMLTLNLILAYYRYASDCPDFDKTFWSTMVGVVTPHKAQRALIVQELFKLFPSHLHADIDAAVDTVERFQGGERNMVIISYGVGDEDIIRQEEEFLLNLNRTNVSVSRAKQQAILIMSEELLQHLTADDDIATHAKAIKRYDHYCKEEKQFTLEWNGQSRELNYRWRPAGSD